jgi:nicotinate-nucleotide adenylyltransferase
MGGSFDPPHLGHLVIASEAHARLGLAGVVLVPAARPPHKEGLRRSPAALRLELTALAVAGDDRFSVSPVEIERDLVYTVDMLAAVAESRPGADLVFVMGSDSLLQFEEWHDPGGIIERCRLAVATRPGDDPKAVAVAATRLGPAVTLLDAPAIGVSSSLVRARVAAGLPIDYLVPPAVAERIGALGLYREGGRA